MDEKKKSEYIKGMFAGATFNNSVVVGIAENGSNVFYQHHPKKEEGSPLISKEVLAKAIEAVQQYFWGISSNAVIFCVCRDRYGFTNNASQYERESRDLEYHKEIKYLCTDGTIANAFRYNPYMKYDIDKWEQNGAKERVLKLRDEFVNAVEKAKSEEEKE